MTDAKTQAAPDDRENAGFNVALPTIQSRRDEVIGVDPHKSTHTAMAVHRRRSGRSPRSASKPGWPNIVGC